MTGQPDGQPTGPVRAETNLPTVLLAEDQTMLREALVEMLTQGGFSVLGSASDGAELLELAEKVEADLVLVDLRMPSVDGIEVARRIKQRWPSTPVIVYSAFGAEGFVKSAEREGVFAYLEKGCPPASIMETLREAWAHRQAILARRRTTHDAPLSARP
jgi:DNA-binding NarL/FixJ family response regulator